MGRPFRRGLFGASQPSKRRPVDRVPGTKFPLRALIIEQEFYKASPFGSVSARGLEPARIAINTVVSAFIHVTPASGAGQALRGCLISPRPTTKWRRVSCRAPPTRTPHRGYRIGVRQDEGMVRRRGGWQSYFHTNHPCRLRPAPQGMKMVSGPEERTCVDRVCDDGVTPTPHQRVPTRSLSQ